MIRVLIMGLLLMCGTLAVCAQSKKINIKNEMKKMDDAMNRKRQEQDSKPKTVGGAPQSKVRWIHTMPYGSDGSSSSSSDSDSDSNENSQAAKDAERSYQQMSEIGGMVDNAYEESRQFLQQNGESAASIQAGMRGNKVGNIDDGYDEPEEVAEQPKKKFVPRKNLLKQAPDTISGTVEDLGPRQDMFEGKLQQFHEGIREIRNSDTNAEMAHRFKEAGGPGDEYKNKIDLDKIDSVYTASVRANLPVSSDAGGKTEEMLHLDTEQKTDAIKQEAPPLENVRQEPLLRESKPVVVAPKEKTDEELYQMYRSGKELTREDRIRVKKYLKEKIGNLK